MPKTLVALDTDRIKQYVFRTSTLKEIRGASSLLDRLNRIETERLVPGAKIFSNGGSGLFVLDGADAAEDAIQAVEQLYRSTTHGATITGALVEVPQLITLPQDEDVDIATELAVLRYRLRACKDAARPTAAHVAHPLFRVCEACGASYAQTGGGGEAICPACRAKREEDEQIKAAIGAQLSAPDGPQRTAAQHDGSLWGRLIADLAVKGYRLEGMHRPLHFEELGAQSVPDGYMALIYADGDGIGREIEAIRTIAQMQAFATAVDDAVYQALVEAVNQNLPPANGVLPFDVLLLGGDDLVMVTAADKAMDAALAIARRFPELTEQSVGRRLRLSVSVVICHVSYPIGALIKLADGCLKFAKRESARRRRQGAILDEGLINFLVVDSSNHLDFNQHFVETLQAKEGAELLLRTQRPYSVDDLHSLLATIRSARQVPRNKLEQLRGAVFKSRRQGAIDAMMAILRLRDMDQRKELLALFDRNPDELFYMPWIRKNGGVWTTPVLDIVELIDFVR